MVAVEPIEPTTLQVLAWVRVHRFASGQVKRLCRTGLVPCTVREGVHVVTNRQPAEATSIPPQWQRLSAMPCPAK
jgi:hypothetical protein